MISEPFDFDDPRYEDSNDRINVARPLLSYVAMNGVVIDNGQTLIRKHHSNTSALDNMLLDSDDGTSPVRWDIVVPETDDEPRMTVVLSSVSHSVIGDPQYSAIVTAQGNEDYSVDTESPDAFYAGNNEMDRIAAFLVAAQTSVTEDLGVDLSKRLPEKPKLRNLFKRNRSA